MADFPMLPRTEIMLRLREMVDVPGKYGEISRNAFLVFCDVSLPVSVEDIGNTRQRRFSQAFYWLDKGYLKVRKHSGGKEVCLRPIGAIDKARPSRAKVLPSIAVNGDGVKLTWR